MKGRNLASIGETYAGPEHIGYSYTGPDFSRPSLRQLPRSWTLEETRAAHRRHWWRDYYLWVRVSLFAVIVFTALGVIAQVV